MHLTNAMRNLLFILAFCLPSAYAQQIYKCGNTFSQQPCGTTNETITVKPASGATGARASSSTPGSMTEADRLNALTEKGLGETRRRNLEDIEVPGITARIAQTREFCAQQQAALEARKYAYVQNMWGVTNRAAVANEQTTLALKCDSDIRLLQERLASYQAECQKLGCRPQR